MASKRKREEDQLGDSVVRPAVGTRTFATGQAVKEGLASGSRQAIVSFHQQIHTYQSKLPLPISHPTITILQHYLDLSPTCDELLGCWKEGDRTRNDRLIESSVSLLGLIVTILRPLPFFRTTLVNLVNKVLTPSEPFSDSINRSLQSERRDLIQATLGFVAGVVNLDPPPIAASHGTGGKLATRMWSVLSDGGSVKGMGKMFSMRIRNAEGKPLYDVHDPNDRADIRHLALQVVLPLLALPNVYSFARTLMPPIYSQLDQDPPVTIFRVLSAIWDVVTLSSPGTSRRISLALVNETSIDLLFKLMPRQDYEPTTGLKVGEIVKSFIEGMTTTPGRGLCFIDDGWYPRQVDDKGKDEDEVRGNREDREKQKLHNRVLANVIRKLGARVIDDDGRLGDLVTKIVKACPELVAGYWAHSALAVDPKLDVRWMATMTFIGRIISLPPPDRSTFRLPAPRGSGTVMPYKSEPPAISTIIESILLSPMHKNHLTRGLQHPDALVRHMTAVTLARGLQKLQVVQDLLRDIERDIAAGGDSSKEGPWSKARRELEFEARRRVPEVLVVITFAQQSAQLAPAEPETDEDKALSAKSTMLTESALRLFGLYYRTLPSLSGEAKFDVGRLLVSSTSAKAEKRERKMLQSGSVADDAGSTASFGTAGTAGMGGGFGYARGEVQGFDALSQVHVLALLRDVKEWDWARKAAASQYTYLYHILQLHLNKQLPFTRELSSSLIDNMLRPTLLFEHDASEISIWLSALPRAHASVSGPLLTVQQIHVLSFLDDCFRRAQQLPYRYVEQLTTLVPDYFPWSQPDRLVSCVLMAILEQFRAKVQGQHMSTDAAVVVLAYLRRVLLALMGKMDDSRFIDAVLAKLGETCEAAKAKGQERPGLETLIDAMKHDVHAAYGGTTAVAFSEATDFPRLVDDEQWRDSSLESLLTHGSDPDLKQKARTIAEHSSPAKATRYARFSVHLLSQHPPTTPIILDILDICLSRSSGDAKAAGEVKAIVFQAACVKDLYLTEKGDEYRHALSSLVQHLNASSVEDSSLVEPYSSRLTHLLKKPKKYNPLQTLALLRPWTSLLDADTASAAVAHLAKASSKLGGLSSEDQNTISGIFKATEEPSIPLAHLSTFLTLKVYRPFTDTLGQPNIFERSFTVDIDEPTVTRLLNETDPEATALVTKLAETCPSVVRLLASVLDAQADLLGQAALLPVVAQLLDLPDPVQFTQSKDRLLLTAYKALGSKSVDVSNAARSVLIRAADPEGLSRLLGEVDLKTFSEAHAQLALDLAKIGKPEHLAGITHVLSIALQQIARSCSDEGDLEMATLETLILTLSIICAEPPHLDISVELAEPVITNVINDRLDVDLAVDLATQLAGRVSLKASFVRQHLQAMLSSSRLVELSETTSTSEQRLAFVKLYSALFTASTYVSCQPNFVEALLAVYRGTMSEADRTVLGMFQTFESVRRVSIASVLRSWSSSGLTGTDRAFDAFTSLDGGKVNNTCALFPLSRKAGSGWAPSTESESNERIYDPVFVLALFGAMLVEGNLTGLEWVEVMRCGGIGIVVCCLSSRDQHMRQYANWLLSNTFDIISNTPFHERDQLLYTLRLVRHSIPSPDKSASFPRVPPLLALFLSYVVRAQATPSHFLYPITSRFLLQRPVLDLTDVPMLYSMLYASEEGWKNERAWIVRLLRDGVKSETDWRVVKRRHTWSLLATLYQSSLDIPFRRLVLQALATFVKIPLAVRSLVNRDCVLSWLSMQWHETLISPNKAADEERISMLRIYETIIDALASAEVQKQESDELKVSNGNGDSVEVDDDGDDDDLVLAEGDRERPGWILDLDIFVQRAAKDSDTERLETLSRLLKTVAPIYLPTDAFLVLAKQLADRPSATPTKVAENLFEAGIYLTPDSGSLQDRLDELQDAVTGLKRRVTASNSELGKTVRSETRAFVFAQID